MSDVSARWVKLWTSCLSDPDLDNLSLEDFGRWCRFLIYVKQHGEKGIFHIKEPAATFCHIMRVACVNDFKTIAEKFPNVVISCNGNPSLHIFSIKNWHKFQVDDSSDRVRKWRDSVTVQEKKRKDKEKEKKRIRKDKEKPPISPLTFEPPEYIESELWLAYLDVRKAKKAAKTERALREVVHDLDKFKAEGHDPNEILRQSVVSGWTGIFPIKRKRDEDRWL